MKPPFKEPYGYQNKQRKVLIAEIKDFELKVEMLIHIAEHLVDTLKRYDDIHSHRAIAVWNGFRENLNKMKV